MAHDGRCPICEHPLPAGPLGDLCPRCLMGLGLFHHDDAADLGPATSGAPETRVGGVRLIEPIARGGMGEVFRGLDDRIGREVAVKMVRGDHDDRLDLARRFVDEARIAGRLQHPGIIPVYQLGEADDGRPYIVMRLVAGPAATPERVRADLSGGGLRPFARGDPSRLEALQRHAGPFRRGSGHGLGPRQGRLRRRGGSGLEGRRSQRAGRPARVRRGVDLGCRPRHAGLHGAAAGPRRAGDRRPGRRLQPGIDPLRGPHRKAGPRGRDAGRGPGAGGERRRPRRRRAPPPVRCRRGTGCDRDRLPVRRPRTPARRRGRGRGPRRLLSRIVRAAFPRRRARSRGGRGEGRDGTVAEAAHGRPGGRRAGGGRARRRGRGSAGAWAASAARGGGIRDPGSRDPRQGRGVRPFRRPRAMGIRPGRGPTRPLPARPGPGSAGAETARRPSREHRRRIRVRGARPSNPAPARGPSRRRILDDPRLARRPVPPGLSRGRPRSRRAPRRPLHSTAPRRGQVVRGRAGRLGRRARPARGTGGPRHGGGPPGPRSGLGGRPRPVAKRASTSHPGRGRREA